VALRPFPPYLLHRLYQRAPLNPSPTFRTRFLRKVGQDVLRTGGERILAVYAGIGSSAPRGAHLRHHVQAARSKAIQNLLANRTIKDAVQMVIVLNDKWHGDDLRERKSIVERRGVGATNVDHAGLGQGNRIIFSAQLTGGIAANGQPTPGFFRQCFPQPLHSGENGGDNRGPTWFIRPRLQVSDELPRGGWPPSAIDKVQILQQLLQDKDSVSQGLRSRLASQERA
jgi:hypothetical protein